jgi:thiol-disulfide isomerase/thioredoxin
MKFSSAWAALAGLAISTAALAQEKLDVGDAPPALDIEKWVSGSETAIEKGKVYVIEFWATWCAPCKRSIPHLNELHQEFEEDGLVLIGISDEDVDTVTRFVRAQGDKMSYRVAVDRRAQTTRAWREAAKLPGIPAVFIVDRESRIQYIGNPLEESFTTTLRSVMEGRFDATLQSQAEPILRAARSARKVRNWKMCMKYLDDVIKSDPRVFAPYALEKFEIMLLDQENSAAAYDYARQLLRDYASDAPFLAELARKIATDPKIAPAQRNLEVAMQAAEASRAAGRPDDPAGYAIVALVQYHSGNVQDAVSLQKNAYFKATPSKKPQYKRVLESYQAAAGKGAAASSAAP